MFSSEQRRSCRARHFAVCPVAACTTAVSVLRAVPGLVCAAALSLAPIAGALADSGTKALLERALAAETESLAVLLDHHRLEQDLLSPDVDRLGVFLSLPPGRVADIEQVQLLLDASRYGAELGKLPADRPLTVPLVVQRIGQGTHTLQLDLRLSGGRGIVSHTLRVDKGAHARFVEFRLDDARSPRLTAQQW